MGLTMISLAGVLGSLRRLARTISGASARHRDASSGVLRAGSRLHMTEGRGGVAWPDTRAANDGARRLRVLRVVDAGHSPSTAGRMVISGRMADVCAELDRMAALEARAA